jgi:hypothetical protein
MKLVVIIWSVAALSICIDANHETLRLVHVFFRHGSRTPELKDAYPTDPYTFETFAPMGWGALTNKGKQGSYKLGQVLRTRYDSFLGDIYIPETVAAYSTDYERTKMTVLLVLAGLFPPSRSQTWNESIPWMPIPYRYDKDRYDFTLRRPTYYCPTYVKELEEVLSSDVVQREIKAKRHIYEYLEEKTKKPMREMLNVLGVYQTLNAEDVMNLTLPEWTKSVYPDEVHEITAKRCFYENYNSILKRLNGGRMLGKVIDQMVNKANSTLVPLERKIFLYSGHENNVINILAALNLFQPHVPKYTASAIVELHWITELQSHGVKVLYLRDADSTPEVLKLEGCDTLCPLNDFIRITEPHVPVNYTAECHSHVNLD